MCIESSWSIATTTATSSALRAPTVAMPALVLSAEGRERGNEDEEAEYEACVAALAGPWGGGAGAPAAAGVLKKTMGTDETTSAGLKLVPHEEHAPKPAPTPVPPLGAAGTAPNRAAVPVPVGLKLKG